MVEKKQEDQGDIEPILQLRDEDITTEDYCKYLPAVSMFQQDPGDLSQLKKKFNMLPPPVETIPLTQPHEDKLAHLIPVKSALIGSQSPFMLVNKAKVQQSQSSAAPESGQQLADLKSSQASRCTTNWDDYLLTWECLTDEQRENIGKLPEICQAANSLRIYHSKDSQKTLVHILASEVNRNYFRYNNIVNKQCKGAKCILSLSLPVPWTISARKYSVEKQLYMFFKAEKDSIETNDNAEAYKEFHTWKEANQMEEFDTKMKVLQKKSDAATLRRKETINAREEIEQQYLVELERDGNKVNLQAFINEQMKESTAKFQAAVKMYKSLKTIEENFKDIRPPVPEKESPEETLRKFCDANNVNRSAVECAQLINDSHHGRILRSVYRIFLDRSLVDKRHVCWLYGSANSGKSQFIQAIRSIFSSEEVSWQGKFMPVSERNREDLEVQLVTCHEFLPDVAFSKENIATTKKLFEGRGDNVRDQLWIEFKFKYKDARFLMASNYLPGTESQGKLTDKFEKDVWVPICARVDFTRLTFNFKGNTVFPYTKEELAHALLLLVDHPNLVKEMEEFDEKEVIEHQESPYSEEASQKFRQHEKLLETNFQLLLQRHKQQVEKDAEPNKFCGSKRNTVEEKEE